LEEVEADRDQITAEVTHFRNAYADAVQKMPAGRQREGGAVRMEFFPEEEGVGFKEQVLDRLPQWVRQMRDAGIRPGEIAILVRSRRDGIRVAQKLLEHQYRLISSESLLLSGTVRFLFSLRLSGTLWSPAMRSTMHF
jgi:ATP-dependent helicase/nuclease subunit A